jgi:hypothetical protein
MNWIYQSVTFGAILKVLNQAEQVPWKEPTCFADGLGLHMLQGSAVSGCSRFAGLAGLRRACSSVDVCRPKWGEVEVRLDAQQRQPGHATARLWVGLARLDISPQLTNRRLLFGRRGRRI